MIENYIEEIAKIIDDFAKSKKELDENYINKVVEPIITSESLQDYVGKITVDNEIEDIGDYEIETGNIRFNLLATINNYKLEKNMFYQWEKTEKKLVRYSFVAGCIFHEIGHAYVLKKGIEGNKEEWEVQLLNLFCKEDIQLKRAILERKNPIIVANLRFQGNRLIRIEEKNDAYDFALEERLADIFSFELLLKVAEVLQVKHLQNYQKWQLYKAYLQGYKSSLFPTAYYLKCIGREDLASSIKVENLNLDLVTRLKYGLRITETEHNKLKREKKRIKKIVR